MRKQDIANWRGKGLAELAAEAKRLANGVSTEGHAHARREQRRDLAQINSIRREKELLAVNTKS